MGKRGVRACCAKVVEAPPFAASASSRGRSVSSVSKEAPGTAAGGSLSGEGDPPRPSPLVPDQDRPQGAGVAKTGMRC